MESVNSSSAEAPSSAQAESAQDPPEKWFSEPFENILPRIQERWPDVARQTLEATRGSFDEVVRVISQQTSESTVYGISEQLEELLSVAGEKTRDFADSLDPLEKQLEELLDDLNKTLRPRIEKPVREKPLFALGVAAGVGVLLGLILAGRRSN